MNASARTLIHLDADAFFASVEQASDPRLRGKAVAVGGEKRGIIASASYEARKLGIYTPMPSARARKLCPKLILLPGDFEKYERFSRWMFSYAYDFTPAVEVCSIDEGYFDLSGSRKPALDVAETLRRAIRQSLKITVSEGIGANKIVSQIACKLRKPASFLHVPAGTERSFLAPLPNRRIPGVGPALGRRLDASGLVRCGQIGRTPEDLLAMLAGSWAPQLKQFANGIDDRPVVPAPPAAKSYGCQETFERDLTDEEAAEHTLRRMAERLMTRVRADGKAIRTVTVKIRYNDFAEDQAGESLPEPTDLETDLFGRLRPLLRKAWRRRVSLRMVSLRFTRVYDGLLAAELPLFPEQRRRAKRRTLARTVDTLREERGRYVVVRGTDIGRGDTPLPPPVSRIPHPPSPISPPPSHPPSPPPFIPLHVHSVYSFLDSTLTIETLLQLAQRHGYPGLALTDTANLHGAVPFMLAGRAAGLHTVLGARIILDGQPALVYVENQEGYRNLCRILGDGGDGMREGGGEMRDPGSPILHPASRIPLPGLLGVVSHPAAARYFAPGACWLGAGRPEALARFPGSDLPRVVVPAVHYAAPGDRRRYDTIQSIRTLTLLDQVHPDKRRGGAFHFPAPEEIRSRFRDAPGALAATAEIAERCTFAFETGRLQFPAYQPPDGSTPRAFLRQLVRAGMHRRYREREATVREQVETELAIIHDVGYEEYFLVVWDLLQTCRERGIDWITRGSAADSLVCYCLGISNVCPVRFRLYFQRFLNRERMHLKKLPDIDIDFPHDRKDAVMDLLFEKYGPEHAAVVGGFSTYRARSAFGDVAKVLGVSEHQVRQVTTRLPWSSADGLAEATAASPECRDLPLDEEPFAEALQAARFLDDFPRYPKMHPCGVVLSRAPMETLTPCFTSPKGYPTTHFDMDAVEAIGLVKLDILAQAGLSVLRDVRVALGERGIDLDPEELVRGDDHAVWEMIASGQARGVHHIESPAMIGLARMCNVRDLDTLIAVVSVIRPGAANQHKKKRFTRRYQGREPVIYPHPSLEACLRDTYGLIVYEEQVLQICETFAGLSPGQGDQLRRVLVKQRWQEIEAFGKLFARAARTHGREPEEIRAVWQLLCGFSGYAFCKAHSTAYGVEAYQSAWLKHYHPAEFMAAVLTQGKGFYRPLVYVLECHRLGVPLLPPCINDPGPAFRVREGGIRTPVTRIKGLSQGLLERLLHEREQAPFSGLDDFLRRAAPDPEERDILLRAGALDEWKCSRTELFWKMLPLGRIRPRDRQLPLPLPVQSAGRVPPVPLTEPSPLHHLQEEMELLGFTASGHPLDAYPDIAWDSYCPVAELDHHLRETVTCCGLVIEDRVAQQEGGELMKFLTLADYTGIIETELFARTYRSYGLATVRYPVLEVTATVEPFENARGHSLRVHRAGPPRTIPREAGEPLPAQAACADPGGHGA